MISVIIPVYNVAPYLAKCLDSVIKQTYTDIEIIIIDDGSTDESGEICDYYTTLDNRIQVIHKDNAGLSSARNVGMDNAKGEWIFFIDSDDWLNINVLNNLYLFAISNECDIVQCNHYYAYDNYLLYRLATKKENKINVLDRKEAIRQLIINDRIKNFAWGKIYKTDLLRNLKFPEGKYFEDSFWQHLVFHRASKIGIINTPSYFYRQRKDSISGQPSTKINDLLEGYSQRLEFITVHYPELKHLMIKKCQDLSMTFYSSIEKGNTLFIQYFIDKIITRLSNFRKYKKVRI